MGTPEFAVPALKALLGAGHGVARGLYPASTSGGARPAARSPPPSRASPRRTSFPCARPRACSDRAEAAHLAASGLDAAVVVAYGLILPRAILATPRLGCLNIHASLLPRWRGAAPIARAILAGDSESGITIMQMDEGLDTGPMLLQERTAIAPDMSAGELAEALAALGARLILEALDGLAAGRLEAKAQPAGGCHLRAQDRQGRGAARLEVAGGAARAPGARLQPDPRCLVRACRRARARACR